MEKMIRVEALGGEIAYICASSIKAIMALTSERTLLVLSPITSNDEAGEIRLAGSADEIAAALESLGVIDVYRLESFG